jgi:hypothetical protein
MTPYEEIETIADFLPDEGKTVTLTRRKGQLIVEDASLHQKQQQDLMIQERMLAAKQRVAEETLFGHLVQASERLQHYSIKSFLFTLLAIYSVSVGVHYYMGWSAVNIPVVVGMALVFVSGYLLNERAELKKRFIYHVCPELDRVLTDRNIDKYQLLGIMRNNRDLAMLARAISRWTK